MKGYQVIELLEKSGMIETFRSKQRKGVCRYHNEGCCRKPARQTYVILFNNKGNGEDLGIHYCLAHWMSFLFSEFNSEGVADNHEIQEFGVLP